MEIVAGFSAIAILTGLVELTKRIGLPDRLAPVASLVLGVALAYFAAGFSLQSVLSGIVLGLSASGLYSGVKNVAGK